MGKPTRVPTRVSTRVHLRASLQQDANFEEQTTRPSHSSTSSSRP
ncbi:unnamed protein product [Arabidopsis halleri]